MPKSPQTRFVENTRILEVQGYGPPLVLVHGLSDSADTWRPLLERLAAQGRYALALDLPGFGAAPDAQPGNVLPQLEAEVVAAAKRAIAATGMAPVLVGNSLGGMVALHVAARNPKLVSAAVPVCSAGLYHPAWIRLIATPALRLVLPVLATRPLRRLSGAALLHTSTTIRSDSAREHLPRLLSHLSRSRLAHQLWIVSRLLKEGAYPLDLESIDCRVLFVWGDRDRAAIWRVNHDHLLAAAQRAPHGHSEVIPGCGHMPQLEMPDELLRLIDAFSPIRTDDEASTFGF